MPVFSARGKTLEADLLVFDKDGLMFESEQFWLELVNTRISTIRKHCSANEAMEWARMMGADTDLFQY